MRPAIPAVAVLAALLAPAAVAQLPPISCSEELPHLRSQAEARYAMGELDRAVEIYAQIADCLDEPRAKSSALVDRAWLLHLLERDAEAQAVMDEALVLDIDHRFKASAYDQAFVDVYYEAQRVAGRERQRLASEATRAGLYELRSQRYGAARERFEAALALVPNYPTALYNLAVTDLSDDRREEATASFQKLLALDQSAEGTLLTDELRVEAHKTLGFLFFALESLEDAEANLQAAVELDPSLADVWHNLGLARDRMGRTDEGIEDLRRAAKLAPQNAEFAHSLAVTLHRAGRWQELADTAAASVARHPDSAALWLYLGLARDNLGEPQAAAEALERVLALDAGNRDDLARRAAQRLTPIRFELGERAAVIDLARRALGWGDQDASLWTYLGLAQRQTGDLEGAAVSLARALELDSGRAESWNNLGAVQLDRGAVEEAEDAFARAMQLDPGLAAAADNLENLDRTLVAAVRGLGLSLAEGTGGEGALVTDVEPRTLAASRLKPGDRIIQADGRAIADGRDLGRWAWSRRDSRAPMALTIVRRGKTREVRLEP